MEEVEGYIYIMQNPVYTHYGEGVYKLGKASDVHKRLKQSATYYVEDTQVLYISEVGKNYPLAENSVLRYSNINGSVNIESSCNLTTLKKLNR